MCVWFVWPIFGAKAIGAAVSVWFVRQILGDKVAVPQSQSIRQFRPVHDAPYHANQIVACLAIDFPQPVRDTKAKARFEKITNDAADSALVETSWGSVDEYPDDDAGDAGSIAVVEME